MRRMATVLLLVAIGLLLVRAGAPAVHAADPIEKAIERIRKTPHASLPPAESRPTRGPAGRGLTVENRTPYALRVYFRGPVTRGVTIGRGRSVGIALAIGRYEVACEPVNTARGVRIIPFYGRHVYKADTHYWLRFFVKRGR